MSRSAALLLLTLGLVGMHQMAAAAHEVSHAAVDAHSGHEHPGGAGDACHGHDTSEPTPACSETHEPCLATVNDAVVFSDMSRGVPGDIGRAAAAAKVVAHVRTAREPPDRVRLRVSRT
jgi:hypothetical protein